MKKLMLTGIAAALFGVAAIAQEQQDTTRSESNEFRQETEQAVDTAANDFQQGVNQAEEETEQATDQIQQEGNEFRRDAEQAGENVQQGAENAADNLEENANDAGDQIKQEADETRQEIRQDGQRAGDQIQNEADEAAQPADQTLDKMNQQFESTVEGDDNAQSANYTPAPELEVVEGKEGPNSEVVYKYKDEFFYVDRDEKKVVKAEESELQDAKHDVIVNDSEKSGDDMNKDAGETRDESNASSDNENQ